LDPQRRLPVLTTPTVEYILGPSSGPEALLDVEIDALRRVCASTARTQPWPYLTVGSRVRIRSGAFSGIEGILVSDAGQDRLILSVTLLQRSVSLEVYRAWIVPLV